jgi:NAD(P)-dependent dehydrogenase (short-subunit alcohol dehydrogenase family)
MQLGLEGLIVVVTGASRGIGLAVAQGFAAEGAHVVVGARSESTELQKLVDAGTATVVEVDLADPAGPDRLVALAGDRIDVLVNNVGAVTPRVDGFLAITDEMWRRTLDLDLMSAVRTMRAAIPVMLGRGGGVIVNVGSINARLPDPSVLDYSAAKSALVSVAKSLSKEFGPRGIRVNTVDPGPVATDLWLGTEGVAARVGAATDQQPHDVAAEAAAEMVTGRFTRPDEVADLVLFLSSSRAGNITGVDYAIDGGLVTTI